MCEQLKKMLQVSDEEKRRVREVYGKTDKDIKQDIAIVRGWLDKQKHLPNDEGDEWLERFLLRNKFRLEQAKQKLDSYYKIKGNHLDFLQTADPIDKEFMNVTNSSVWISMPKLTSNLERVSLWKIIENDDSFDFDKMILYILTLMELQLSYDYFVAERIILDLSGFNSNHMKRIYVTSLARCNSLHQKAYCGRIAGIEVVNSSSVVNLLLELLKHVMKPKVFAKIRFHENLESLHKVVPVENLPVEFGGTCGSIVDVHHETGKMLREQRNFIVERMKKHSNEALRMGDVIKDENFGVEGSFKKLNLD